MNKTLLVTSYLSSSLDHSSPEFCFAEFEGQEEYSCKVFAERLERLKLTSQGEGPLVRVHTVQVVRIQT